MLKLEEYIAERIKKEDVDIYDLEHKQENMKQCVDFVFEYFNDYLDKDLVERSNLREDKKTQKYRQKVKNYSDIIQNWLIDMYKEHHCYTDTLIVNYIKKDILFMIYSTKTEFDKLSYNCYSKLSSKYKWLVDYIPQMNQFIKEYHTLCIQDDIYDVDTYNIPRLSNWVKKTNKKYNVNLINFAHEYAITFSDMPSKWDRSKEIFGNGYKYSDYDIVNSKNKFDIKGLYSKCSYMPFMKNRKRDLELLIFLLYDYDIENVPTDFKKKYLESMHVEY